MTFFLRGAGWKADTRDDRDARLTVSPCLGGNPPAMASAAKWCPPIMDQGPLGSCVANAVSVAVYAAHRRRGETKPQHLSRLFLYYFARNYDHLTDVDSGTMIRLAFRALNKYGFCPELDWPHDTSQFPPDGGTPPFAKKPNQKALRAAYDQRAPTSYRRIYDTGQERLTQVKRAIAAGMPVVFGTQVSKDFAANDFDARHPVEIPTGKPIAGGHAMAIVAYDGDAFVVQNSWGKHWGTAGRAVLSEEYITWDESRDFWVVDSAPHYSVAA